MQDQCEQKNCEKDATHRMFWPGQEPLLVCETHREKGIGVATAMGFYLAIEPLTESDYEEKP